MPSQSLTSTLVVQVLEKKKKLFCGKSEATGLLQYAICASCKRYKKKSEKKRVLFGRELKIQTQQNERIQRKATKQSRNENFEDGF